MKNFVGGEVFNSLMEQHWTQLLSRDVYNPIHAIWNWAKIIGEKVAKSRNCDRNKPSR